MVGRTTGHERFRDRGYRAITRSLAVALLPVAHATAPHRARHLACQWALAARFPAENLTGLTPRARAAFTAARAEALWRDGVLIGLTSGHRTREEQSRLFAEAVRRNGSPEAARRRVLPPHHHLYRVYDNEWWHFEHRPDGPPERLPDPGGALADLVRASTVTPCPTPGNA